VTTTTSRHQKAIRAVNLGLFSNIVLATLKTSVGILGHSPALLADGINSTSDVAYGIVVAIFMRQSRKPADDEHPYGHSQLESIAALVVGSFVVTTAVAVFWDAVNAVYDLLTGRSDGGVASLGALWIALATVAIKFVMTILTNQIGKQLNNAAVQALAFDHRNDIFSALGAFVGILLGRMGHRWVDPFAGALVALVILRTGIGILRDASADLMDAVPGNALSEQITELLLSISAIKQVEEIQAHRFGPYLVINLTIGINGSLSVAEGDDIATQAERALYKNIDLLRRVYIHYHPAHVLLETNR
jgi:cation diffusion facilitator family transporter